MAVQTVSDQQAQYLKEALQVVLIQSKLMRQCLDKHRLMDGIKHCSNMLGELRTSLLSPKNYYELYISIFDAMRYLIDYLLETHQTGKYHLGDLYELVQYASSIVPRLYLMTTVGSIYLSVDDAPPVAEVMSDMMEMTRGVQHPIRGLFLRHYLGGMTRDFLPHNADHLSATIQFILTNFAEMNKLWVRLQHMGHTRDRAKRESERKELGTLVGTNLVRLSQLEGVDLNMYQTDILPGILSQVISCHDVMAQEYLMEVIIQIFPDEFHIHTLKPFLATTAQLHANVNIKMIIMALLDRLATYSKDEQANMGIQEEEGERGREESNALFLMFWNEIMELVKSRRELPVQDQTSLFLSLANFSISCYPDRLDYMDQILHFTKESIFSQYAPELHTKQSEQNVLQLLLLPSQTWDVLTLITTLKHYQPLLAIQPYSTRRTVGLAILDNILEKETRIDQPKQVYQILEICHVLIKDHKNTFVSQQLYQYEDEDDRDEQGWVARLVHLFYSEDEDTQFLLLSAARQQLENGDQNRIKTIFPSLIVSSLKLATRYFYRRKKEQQKQQGTLKTGQKEQETPVKQDNAKATDNADDNKEKEEEEDVFEREDVIVEENGPHEKENELVAMATSDADRQDGWNKKMTTLYHFIHQIIMIFCRQCENTEVHTVQFFLMAGQNANYCGFEETAFELYLDAFRVYEESVSHSRAQFNAIVYSIGSLLKTSPRFQEQYFNTLSTKITLYSTKLLKKPDQSRAVYLSSHLWMQGETPSRIIECLQKSLKIADSCMDAVTNEMLFLELLNQYIYYFESGQSLVTANYLNGLMDLISSRLMYINQQDQHPFTSNSSSLLDHDDSSLPDYIIRQFDSILAYLRYCRERSPERYTEIELPTVNDTK
ncbi:vacuolar protein sorting-associated protein 35 [Mucor ambiguus]|uniref:Vacuolar protein sorting-associated protein 35 n=1 Tax=Mucor ambiguus TaxID=91626 RepID=A0A0C9MLE0_9FUNG|nr:vacuolar protein sorting-associated protein 35 [Mucor ambiguus]